MARFDATPRFTGSQSGEPFRSISTREASSRFENTSIHPTARIAEDVEIGPFTVVGPDCEIARGNRINNNVTLHANVTLGEGNEIYPGAVIGGIPQDKKYAGEYTSVKIGSGNVFRENVTVSSGTKLGGGVTIIGDQNLIMAGCHIAHDSVIGDEVTMANNVLLGGHVKVESHASFGGLAAVHHFVTVGSYAFVGGLSRVTQDIPPYMLIEGNPSKIWSINRVGLKRHGFDREVMQALKVAHRLLFRSARTRSENMANLRQRYPDMPEITRLLESLEAASAGGQGRARQPLTLESPPSVWHNFPVKW